jgi:hypothetical protein
MTLELFGLPDSGWQPLLGTFPSALLDTHPSGKFVAMQVLLYDEVTIERAAIWNTKSRQVHWNPGNANALCWIENGSELLVLEETRRGYGTSAAFRVTDAIRISTYLTKNDLARVGYNFLSGA